MKYSVSYKGNNFVSTIISVIVFPIFVGLCVYFLLTDQTEQKTMLIIGIVFFSLFTLLMIYALYRSIRPRIRFSDGVVTYYPLWKKKRVIDISMIDERREETVDYRNRSGLKMYFELLVYRNATLVFNFVSYLCKGKEVLRFDLNMKNSVDFDKYIRSKANL